MKQKLKNNSGFTLIELLVTIALMLTILGIAIVSFINVSERKKQEAWQQVIAQIETAAKEYFISNEYLFEGLSSEAIGTISVGKLVEEDYLNNITNPVTGKKISNCTLVNVTKNENKYSVKLDETTAESSSAACDTNNFVSVEEVGAPSVDGEVKGTMGTNGWFKAKPVSVKLNISTNNNGAISDVKLFSNLCSLNSNKEEITCKENGTDNLMVKVTNTSGKSATWSTEIKIDSTEPTMSLIMKKKTDTSNLTPDSAIISSLSDYTSNTWYNKDVYLQAIYGEAGPSGQTGSCTPPNGNSFSKWRNYTIEGNSTINCKVTTGAGNEYKFSKIVKIDKTAPTFNISMKKKNNSTDIKDGSGLPNYYGDWYNGYIFTAAVQKKDELSGIASVKHTTTGATSNVKNADGATRNINAEGSSKVTYTVCDNANNCTSKSENVYIERTVTLRLDSERMKEAKSSINNKSVFAGVNSGCSSTDNNCYYSSTSFRGCNSYSSSNRNGCNIGDPRSNSEDRAFIGIACMNVGDFPRYFYVSSVRFDNVKIQMPANKTSNSYSGGDLLEDTSQMVLRKNCSFSGGYDVNCGSSAGSAIPNFTVHAYYFKSDSGAKSNDVILYTRYSDDCGY